MAGNEKMKEVKRVAEQVIKKAYENGGKIYYDDVKDLITCDFDSLDRILVQYGKPSSRIGSAWYSFELNPSGFTFHENGGFDGIKKQSDQQKIIADLTEKNLELQNNELEYQKRIRMWKNISVITGLAGTLIGGLLSFFI